MEFRVTYINKLAACFLHGKKQITKKKESCVRWSSQRNTFFPQLSLSLCQYTPPSDTSLMRNYRRVHFIVLVGRDVSAILFTWGCEEEILRGR